MFQIRGLSRIVTGMKDISICKWSGVLCPLMEGLLL